ncbi:MAG: ABC transporter permease [Chitinivibrionales bacterium]|nr:ABC transporter permease [Chitinivibrionales bacterium]
MIALKIALATLLRRKLRMAMISLLVFLGTILIIVGQTVSLSAKHFSRLSIINYFTGDIILYSENSKAKPSPFSFTTPLPVVRQPHAIEAWLEANPLVEQHVAIAQNYGLLSIDKNEKKIDVPFIFYAVDPAKYRNTFPNITMKKGAFFNTDGGTDQEGVVLSAFQAKNYSDNYSVDLKPGDAVTLLSLSDGGSVNAYGSKVIGIYEPKYYKNVFDYINFIDITSYSRLYNFTAVASSSLPDQFNKALSLESEQDIFDLAAGTDLTLETKNLVTQELTGYTMIAVKLKDHRTTKQFLESLKKENFKIKTAFWNEASGFFAYVAAIIQAVIYGATFLIFLIVVFILMNTLIITVLERTAEIGTLRALGGERGFISAIFLWESLLLNGTAALLGMIFSLVFLLIAGQTHGFALPQIMQQYLLGGGTLQLLVTARPFIESLGIIVVVSVLATLYPIRVATAITPLKAMSQK